MNTEFLKMIQEQMRNENDTEKMHISPMSEYDYIAFDKLNFKFYWFVFDKNSIKDDSNTVDMWIVDMRAATCLKYPIVMRDYTNTGAPATRIEFTERYIQKFMDDEKKYIDDQIIKN